MPDPNYLIKPLSFFEEFSRKSGDASTTHYCPGCGHGIIHKILAEAIDELGIQDRTILVGSVGCSVFIYYYFETSAVSAPHGRAPAVATGISRTVSDAITISYQGDGDLAAIGTSHTIHTANRGENMIVIFVNNSTYGMTGGQLAPTSLLGQKTATSPEGRSFTNEGPPIKMAEIIAALDAPVFVARGAVNSPKNVRKCREMVRKGLKTQIEKKGYVFLEILSPCPTNWKLSPDESCDWIENVVAKEFPLGVFKDIVESKKSNTRFLKSSDFQQILDLVHPQQNFPLEASQSVFKREIRIKCAGFGGQGVLSLGLAFANIAVRQGLEVTWLPSYGPEMRGGVANCSVVLSDHTIGSPLVESPDILIAMNKPSLARFGPTVCATGMIVYNSSMVDEIPPGITARLLPIDAGNMAIKLGSAKVSNTIMLAYAVRSLKLFTLEQLRGFVDETFSQSDSVRRNNLAAIDAGWGEV